MELDKSIEYHPTLRILCDTWLKQALSHRALNFLLYVGVLHNDARLTQYCVNRGADVTKGPEKWYVRFLGNMKSPALKMRDF